MGMLLLHLRKLFFTLRSEVVEAVKQGDTLPGIRTDFKDEVLSRWRWIPSWPPPRRFLNEISLHLSRRSD